MQPKSEYNTSKFVEWMGFARIQRARGRDAEERPLLIKSDRTISNYIRHKIVGATRR